MPQARLIMIYALIFATPITVQSKVAGRAHFDSRTTAQGNTKVFRFAFSGPAGAAGSEVVTGATTYSASRGYGFEPGTKVVCTDSNKPNRNKGGSCTSDQTFLFSVAVPEGNYLVTVTLGNGRGISNTTVKAESRRLMVERAPTVPGEFVQRRFVVNVRNFQLPNGGAVALKDRERDSFTWDDKLTLEFGGLQPSVSTVTIEPAPDAVTVFLAGDSTVTDQTAEPWAAWGQMLPRFFDAKVAVANYAESGESLRSFRAEGRREKLFSKIRRGDYLFIQFAHNDQKPGPSHVDAFTDYAIELRDWIVATRRQGAIPVLVTSMHRRTFDAAGRIVNSLGDYPQAMRDVAAAEKVALIDLHAMSQQFYEALGPVNSTRAFVHYPAHTFPGQDQALADNTHFNNYGAYELAKCVVRGIRGAQLRLTRNLVSGLRDFDPSRPDPWHGLGL